MLSILSLTENLPYAYKKKERNYFIDIFAVESTNIFSIYSKYDLFTIWLTGIKRYGTGSREWMFVEVDGTIYNIIIELVRNTQVCVECLSSFYGLDLFNVRDLLCLCFIH